MRHIKALYYAHSLKKYFSVAEKEELKRLAELFPGSRIVNPNGKIASMEQAYQLVDSCDGVVATEFLGHIGKGVHSEILHALELGRKVMLLRDRQLYPIATKYQLEIVDEGDWAVNYAKIRIGVSLVQLQRERMKQWRRVEETRRELQKFKVPDDVPAVHRSFWLHKGKLEMIDQLLGALNSGKKDK